LISENKSSKRSGIPGLQDLPLMGKLFRADTDSSDKTELVVLVTPHIISGSEDWTAIKEELNKALDGISL
jgi:general secretion pathway protein D